jgi:8-oxo-dGTP diphosphatase
MTHKSAASRNASRSVHAGSDFEPTAPVVDLRTVLFTVAEQQLLVALRSHPKGSSLPRDLPSRGESLDLAARRLIREGTGFAEQYLEQLYTLSVNEPSDRWSIIISYLALICSGPTPQQTEGIVWQPASAVADVSAADRMVIDYAVVRLRAKLGYTNIAFHLLPERFTLTELQHAYETILSQSLDKRNFRRRMTASGILTQTNDKRRDGSHRPAALYRFRAESDTTTYLTPPWAAPANGETTT